MKRLLGLFFCLMSLSVFAQNPHYQRVRTYQEALDRGKMFAANSQYDSAVSYYNAALAFEPDKKSEVETRIKSVFVAINKKKEEAEQARLRAENAEREAQTEKQRATQALVETQKQKEIAEKAKNEAEIEKQNAQTNLEKANKLIDAFYFYDDKFALAYKNQKFYFIDKKGDKVAKLGEWEKAEQFNEYGNNFTVVWKGDKEYYLDTLGNFYPLAYSPQNLNTEIKALKTDHFSPQILENTQLEVLILRTNAIPDEIAKMQNLTTLYLNGSSLTSLPKQIGSLKKLKRLNLWGNTLENLPQEIWQLKSLTELDLTIIGLSNLSEQIAELDSLEYLELSANQLVTLPEQITKLKKLSYLGLKENKELDWEKTIGVLAKMPQKVEFVLEKGKGEKGVLYVKIDHNQLFKVLEKATEAQKKQLKNLTELSYIKYFLDSLSPQIGELKNLESLVLPINSFSDLPIEIGELKKLGHLDLAWNKLKSLPRQIAELKNLTYLNLNHNEFAVLPNQIAELKNLSILDLGENNQLDWQKTINLLSKMPQKILFTLDSEEKPQAGVLWVSIDKTQIPKLEDATMEQLAGIKGLEILDFRADTVLDWRKTIAVLSKIPQKILFTLNSDKKPKDGVLRVLVTVYQIPKILGVASAEQSQELKNLSSLSLKGNNLSRFPVEIGELTNLKELDLSENQLNSLAPEIGKLKNLTKLDLSENQLKSFPVEIGELKNLRILSLKRNAISVLPKEIGELKDLAILDLRQNANIDWQKSLPFLSNLPKKILFTFQSDKQAQDDILWLIIDNEHFIRVLEKVDSEQSKELRDSFGSYLDLSQNTDLDWAKIWNFFDDFPKKIKLVQTEEYWSPDEKSEIFQIMISPSINLPPSISQIKNLYSLDLCASRISFADLNRVLSSLPSLQSLSLRHLKLKNLPDAVFELKNLTELIVNNDNYEDGLDFDESDEFRSGNAKNQLVTVSKRIAELKNLNLLDLKGNQVRTLPTEIGELKNLKTLYLIDNPISEEEKARIRRLLPNCKIEF